MEILIRMRTATTQPPSSQTLDKGKYKYWAAEKWKITRYMFNQDIRNGRTQCVFNHRDRWLRCIEIYEFNELLIVLLYWWHDLHFNVEQNKDPVGNGEGGVDDGDEEEADVLDLLLGLTLPHALHQLGHLEQHAGNGWLSCSPTVHSQMTKKMGRTQKKAQTSK